MRLRVARPARDYESKTLPPGEFQFPNLEPGEYRLSVTTDGKEWALGTPFGVSEAALLSFEIVLASKGQTLTVRSVTTQSSGGERLSSSEVSSLPLNTRDFSKLLLLAAGTMTDTNGAANFTQQFAVNGQRGR